MRLLLIYPPVVKPCEPPPGLARLRGALMAHGIENTLLDANLEGMLALIASASAGDVWTGRAVKNRSRHLNDLRNRDIYANPARYRRAVSDLNRLAAIAGRDFGIQLSLSNYQDENGSPLIYSDLMKAAEAPEANPFYPYFSWRLAALMEANSFSCVGLSLNYLSQALTAFAMIGFLKKKYPTVKVILGGGLITSWMSRSEIQKAFAGCVDAFIAGPGERPLLEMNGIPCSSDEAFTPDFAGLALGDYLSPGPILPYSASSGCYWQRCTFCPERAEGNPYRPVPRERVMDDLRALQTKGKPVLIHFLDNAISPALMETMIRDHAGAPWYGFARITPHLADPDFCRALKRSGCAMLQLGLESGDQDVLDHLEKGIDLEMASLALANLKKAGIGTYVYLLFGTPWENERGARKTLAFTVRHRALIDFINTAIFNLPAASESAQILETGWFYEGDLSLYREFSHPQGWDRKSVRRFVEKEFKQHPAVRPIVLRDPPVFTSNHAPFFAGCP